MKGLTESSPDLFGTAPIAGLELMSDIVTPAEAIALAERIDKAGLSPFRFQGWLGKRLTNSYGSGYDFDGGKFALAAPMPVWLEPLRARAAAFAGLPEADLGQALLIRYDPGAGIGWHRDRPHYEHVVGISLGAPATIRFRRSAAKGFDRINVPLVPCSAYYLADEARHGWEHSIAEMTETRWSITFRSLSASGLEAMRRASLEQS